MSTGRPADAPMTLVDSGVPGPASTAAERAVADRSEGGSKAHRDWMLTAVLLVPDARDDRFRVLHELDDSVHRRDRSRDRRAELRPVRSVRAAAARPDPG